MVIYIVVTINCKRFSRIEEGYGWIIGNVVSASSLSKSSLSKTYLPFSLQFTCCAL
jgi:hypothetical protein